MLPPSLLPQLSPIAAKLYLVLLSLRDPAQSLLIISAPISTLSRLAALTPRSCTRALNQLESLHLLKRQPQKYHTPHAYLLIPPQLPQPTPSASFTISARSRFQATDPTPQSPLPPSNQTLQSPLPKNTSHLTRKNPNQTPQASLLTQNQKPNPTSPVSPPTITDRESKLLLNPTFLKILMSVMHPKESTQLISLAQSTLAQLPPETGAPQ